MALSLQTIKDKNSLGTDAVFHILLKVVIPGNEEIYVTNNTEDVVWGGKTWIAFYFDISELSENNTGEVPQWVITLDNRSRVVEAYLTMYDLYLKEHGILGNEVKATLYVVNSKDLDNTVPIKTATFELNEPSANSETATFVMSVSNPFTQSVPKRRFIQNFCYWKFKSPECGYTGAAETCDKTLKQCRAYGNNKRFGGFPGVGGSGIRT